MKPRLNAIPVLPRERLVHDASRPVAILLGGCFMLAVEIINFGVIAPAAFPWLESAHSGVTVLLHVMFGGVTAITYLRVTAARRSQALQRRDQRA